MACDGVQSQFEVSGVLCEQRPIVANADSPYEKAGACSCPAGWWAHSRCRGCYRYMPLHSDHRTWASARAACLAAGSDLALVDSKGEGDFLVAMLKQIGAPSAFVGNGRHARRGLEGWALWEHWDTNEPSSFGECAVLQPTIGDESGDQGAYNSPDEQSSAGRWKASSCHAGPADCIVCQSQRLAAGVVMGARPASSASGVAEEWAVEALRPLNETAWSREWLAVRLRHVARQQYMTCDPATGLLTLLPKGDEGGGRSTFLLDADDKAETFHLRFAKPTNAGLLGVTRAEGGVVLHCDELDETQEPQGPRAFAVFHADRPLLALAARWLRLAVVPRSSDLQLAGLRECSISAFDSSPNAPSYRCRPRTVSEDAQGTGQDLVWLEQQSLLIFDFRRYLLPRIPLPEAGTQCINEASVTTFCTFAFGQGLTIGRTFTIDWNYLLFRTQSINLQVTPSTVLILRGPPLRRRGNGTGGGGLGQTTGAAVSPVTALPIGGTLNAGGGAGGIAGSPVQAAGQSTTTALGDGDAEESPPPAAELYLLEAASKGFQNDLTFAFQNFYEVSTTRGYVETRNWQFTITVPPRSATSIEFFQEVVAIK